MCPNDRCPFHGRFQDEIVRWSPPDEDEEVYIEAIRAKLRSSADPNPLTRLQVPWDCSVIIEPEPCKPKFPV